MPECGKVVYSQVMKRGTDHTGRSERLLPVVVSPVFINGMSVLRAFRRRGARCVAVSSRREVAGFWTRAASEKVLLSDMEAEPGVFTQWLLSRPDLAGAMIIPTGDEIVAELDENRALLEGRFRLLIPGSRACRVALDKLKLARAAEAAGVAGPVTVEVAGDGPVTMPANLAFPVMVKPRYCIEFSRVFARKVAVIADDSELDATLSRCRELGIRVVLQELLGDAAPVAAYSGYVRRSGEIAGDFATLRRGMLPPGLGTGFLEVVAPVPGVIEQGRALLAHLDYRGALVNMDFKLDLRDGVWKLLDLNARSWRQVSLAAVAGVDVLDHMIRDYMDMPPLSNGRARYGTSWFYLKDALLAGRAYPSEAPRMADYLRVFMNRRSMALFHHADLRPFLYDLRPLFQRRLSKLAWKTKIEQSPIDQ